MRTIYVIALFAFLLCMAGCTENEMIEYQNDPAIYFQKGNEFENKIDSINQMHSFFLVHSDTLYDIVMVRIRTMGKLEPVDRPFSVVQTNEGQPNAAIPGLHYIPFDDPFIKEVVMERWNNGIFFIDDDNARVPPTALMVIPANSNRGWAPVAFLRHPDLDLNTIRLEIAVAGNEYFRPGINANRKFALTTTAMAVKPKLWDTFWYSVFGRSWGTVKMRFIIDITGYTEWDQRPNDIFYTAFLRTLVLEELKKYNNMHPGNPLQEANGELVNFDL
jgi:hypothetical protein